MKQYLVIKSVSLVVGKKIFRKDAVITADDVGEDKIARYLDGGYIRLVGENTSDEDETDDDTGGNEEPFYLTTEDYLTPEELDGLKRKDLLVYAEHIGAKGFRPNIGEAKLREFINNYIENLDDDDADDETDDDTGGNEEDKPGGDA